MVGRFMVDSGWVFIFWARLPQLDCSCNLLTCIVLSQEYPEIRMFLLRSHSSQILGSYFYQALLA
jgi:hypothetical protein